MTMMVCYSGSIRNITGADAIASASMLTFEGERQVMGYDGSGSRISLSWRLIL